MELRSGREDDAYWSWLRQSDELLGLEVCCAFDSAELRVLDYGLEGRVEGDQTCLNRYCI